MDDGCYRYYCNSEKTAIVEPWCRHRDSDGAQVIRAVRTDNTNFLLGVSHRCESGKQRLALRWQQSGSGQSISAEYDWGDGMLVWSRSDGAGGERQFDEAVWLFPLMRVFTGDVLLALGSRGGEGEVLVPSIKTPDQPETLFLPEVSVRQVSELAPGCFLYGGGEYEESATCWLDDDGLMQKYRWQQSADQLWTVSLHRND